jgi:signal transduction histidine kinase
MIARPGRRPRAGTVPGEDEVRPTISLRSRIRRVILGAAGIALLLFAVPLAATVAVVVRSHTITALQHDATRVSANVPDAPIVVGRPLAVPGLFGSADIGVYTRDGTRVVGAGPLHSKLAALPVDTGEHEDREDGEYAVSVPVVSDGTVIGTVRAGTAVSGVVLRIVYGWIALLVLAGCTLALTRLVAARLASRVAMPVEQLTDAARALGAGAFDLTLPKWGLRETDEAGSALLETARRIGAVVHRERAFTRDVSHQLRTPLAGLLTGLENALREPDEARRVQHIETSLGRARHLQTIVADLLAVRSTDEHAPCDVAAEVRAAVTRHQLPSQRAIRLRCDDVPAARCPAAVVRQVLDVLLDNATRHGAGDITVTVEALGDSVAVEVSDEGAGFAVGAVPGTGLRLAEDMAESVYGALLVRRRAPRPRIALLVPAVPDPAQPDRAESPPADGVGQDD